MKMLRQTVPEFRALIVENDFDFRRELVFLVDAMDFGISVTDAVGDFDEALERLHGDRYDLLITGIKLTDSPGFEAPADDGIALAECARHLQGIPAIFLTASGDHDPAVVDRAVASDPIGFIRKDGDSLGEQTRGLIQLALRRLEAARRTREARKQLESVLQQLCDAMLYIAADGRILDLNESAARLLEREGDALLDAPWADVLQVEGPIDGRPNGLARAIDAGAQTQIAALALKRPHGESLLVSATVVPSEHLQEPCLLVMLKDLVAESDALARLQIDAGSSYALVGVSGAPGASDLDATQLRIAMLDLYELLQTRLRPGDRLGPPNAATVSLFLPDTSELEAQRLLTAVLAEVEPIFQQRYAQLSVRAGVACRSEGRSIYSTAAAGIDALERAERGARPVVIATRIDADPSSRSQSGERVPALNFTLVQALLHIPAVKDRRVAELGDTIADTVALLRGLRGFAICSLAEGPHAPRWLLCRRVDEDGVMQDCEPGELDGELPGLVARKSLVGSGMRMMPLGDRVFTSLPLEAPGAFSGLGLVIMDKGDARLRAVNAREKELAAVAGRHVARLLAGCPDVAPWREGSRPGGPVWSLRPGHRVIAETSLLLSARTPIALVSEPGMARVDLLRTALRAGAGDRARRLEVVYTELWPAREAREKLKALLMTCDADVLLLPETHHLTHETQALLGELLQTRRVPPALAPAALAPSLSFAVTLPEPPWVMAERSALHPKLASALHAGVVSIPPLRSPRGDLQRWAALLLEGECLDLGITPRSFSTDALAAINACEWRGNLKELRARIAAALRASAGSEVTSLDLGLQHLRAIP